MIKHGGKWPDRRRENTVNLVTLINPNTKRQIEPQAKKQRFEVIQDEIRQLVGCRKMMNIIQGKYFVDHSFSGFEN